MWGVQRAGGIFVAAKTEARCRALCGSGGKCRFAPYFLGFSDISLPSLAPTMFDDVCEQKTWFFCLTLVENDIE